MRTAIIALLLPIAASVRFRFLPFQKTAVIFERFFHCVRRFCHLPLPLPQAFFFGNSCGCQQRCPAPACPLPAAPVCPPPPVCGGGGYATAPQQFAAGPAYRPAPQVRYQSLIDLPKLAIALLFVRWSVFEEKALQEIAHLITENRESTQMFSEFSLRAIPSVAYLLFPFCAVFMSSFLQQVQPQFVQQSYAQPVSRSLIFDS